MRSSDWSYVTLALLAFALSAGLFFYLGLGYGSSSQRQVAKVVVPLDSEADDLRAELFALKAEKDQLTQDVAALTEERAAIERESAAVREERDHLLAVLAGEEKSLAASGGKPGEPAAESAGSEATLASALTATESPAEEQDGEELAPAIETAAGPPAEEVPQIASRSGASTGTADAPSAADSPATPNVQVIYPTGTPEAPISLQPAPATLDQAVVSQALEAGLEAFKDGKYRLAYDTWLPLAEAGVRRAQFYVGGLFHDGRGIGADIVKAHYWLSLSDRAGYPLSRPLLTEIEAKMTAEQLAAAQNLLAARLPTASAD